jgi:hypothetical protein
MVSASDFAPKDFRGKPESCLLAIQHGSEIGLSPMQALQSIAVVNGRPSVYGDTALAVCIGSPVCEYVRETVEGDGEAMVAICEAKRRGYEKPTVVRFSVADAKKAGLWGKSGPWTQYSRRMLQMRARGFCLRDSFPDVLRGLITAEEAQDFPATEPAKAEAIVKPFVAERVLEALKFAPPLPAAVEVALAPSAIEKARAAVSRATTVDRLEALRTTADERLGDGTFTEADHQEICKAIHAKLDGLLAEAG